MSLTKTLTLTSTFQDIIVQSVCRAVLVKEDESVAGWPTTALIIKKPGTGAPNTLTAGKSYTFECLPGKLWIPGNVIGQIATPSASTTGIQDEM